MQLEDMILISTDDHAIEPPDMFRRHAPASLLDQMPHVVVRNGMEFWVLEGKLLPNLANNAVAGRPDDQQCFEPTSYAQMRRGCYDVHARVEDMSVDGVLAGLNFPSFPGACGQTLLQMKDRKLAYRIVQAYNDWHIDEWCGSHPDRFIPCALMPMWDPQLMAQEVRRVKAKGCNSIVVLPNPIPDGLPSWHGDYWDPMWAACDENEVIVNMHISDATRAVPSPDTAVEAFFTCMNVTLYSTAVDLVYCDALKKFRNVKIALSEGGAGWAANAVERMDFTNRRHHSWTHSEFDGKTPGQVFRDRFITCVISGDRTGIVQREVIGLDHMTWENDFPHSETNWPKSPEFLWEIIHDIPDDHIDKITHRNAMNLYQFDPFKIRPREKCTVGALRDEAKNVDTRPLDVGGIPPKRGAGKITLRDVMGQLGEAYSLHIES